MNWHGRGEGRLALARLHHSQVQPMVVESLAEACAWKRAMQLERIRQSCGGIFWEGALRLYEVPDDNSGQEYADSLGGQAVQGLRSEGKGCAPVHG